MLNFLTKLKIALPFLFVILLFGSCTTWRLGKSGQKKVSGKTYVIVGGSSGFGRGVAEELGRYGANVVVAARRAELLEELFCVQSGIRSISLALNQELRLAGHKDIEVVTIEPWAVDTPFWRHAAN